MDQDNLFSFEGYEIPIRLVNLTGGGPESFGAIGESHISHLEKSVGLDPLQQVLEIGCGIGRDAIQLAKTMRDPGRYTGIDIIGESIAWCTDNITAKHPAFAFLHFDVADQLHNPKGVTKSMDIRIPLPDGSIDRIILWSVFTHMFEDDIVHYLREFKRLLKSDGRVFATCFIVDEDIIAAAQRTNLTPFDLQFRHLHAKGCYINDTAHPAGAVAYTEEQMLAMITDAGLKVAGNFQRGGWSSFFPAPDGPGQDAIILSA